MMLFLILINISLGATPMGGLGTEAIDQTGQARLSESSGVSITRLKYVENIPGWIVGEPNQPVVTVTLGRLVAVKDFTESRPGARTYEFDGRDDLVISYMTSRRFPNDIYSALAYMQGVVYFSRISSRGFLRRWSSLYIIHAKAGTSLVHPKPRKYLSNRPPLTFRDQSKLISELVEDTLRFPRYYRGDPVDPLWSYVFLMLFDTLVLKTEDNAFMAFGSATTCRHRSIDG